MIGLCTDSGAQLPVELVEQYGIEVVPMTVIIDEHEYLEGVSLDVDAFYRLLASDAQPEVATTHPSAGQLALAYEQLVSRGATEILSIHVSQSVSSTLSSARVAAHCASVPVRLIDTANESFGVACCVLAAARAIEAGADLAAAAVAAESVAHSVTSVYVADGLEGLPCAAAAAPSLSAQTTRVLMSSNGEVNVVASVNSLEEVVDTLVRAALGVHGPDIAVLAGVGVGDLAAAPIADAVRARMLSHAEVREVITYRIGPSAGACSVGGGVGVFVVPAD